METAITADSRSKREEEQSFFFEDTDQPVPPESVVAYNELRSCADLARLHALGKLELQPDFQRELVWKPEEQSRFIDSLTKQLPIPSMCFSLDYSTQRWKVIDGLQRMSTITAFLGNADYRLYDLPDIHPLLRGKTNNALRGGSSEQRAIFARVEDVTVPVTVIRCNYNEESHLKYLFMIFTRLNSGGVRLNNQEIRNCIYSGRFNDALKQFDRENKDWRSARSYIWGKMDRFRSVEILLRILAFGTVLSQYSGNLAGFLNSFMYSCTKLTPDEIARRIASLSETAALTKEVLGYTVSGKKSLTIVEALAAGIYASLPLCATLNTPEKVKPWATGVAKELRALPAFSGGATYALANQQRVKDRIGQTIDLVRKYTS